MPTKPNATRRTLLERVRDTDDQVAWREFEETYRELVLRYAMRRGLQLPDAEDLLQAVLLRLAKHLPGFRYDPALGSFRGFLYRIVENERKRRGARQVLPTEPVEDLTILPDPGDPELEALWEQEWTQHHLRRAMAHLRPSLSPQSLDVFQLLLNGQSPDAIAGALGLTTQAVYKIKQRVRERLEERLQEQVHDEELHGVD